MTIPPIPLPQQPEPAAGGGSLPDLAGSVDRVAAPLREQVLSLLQREIVEMRLLPGQRLVERELIERIGVSRTTIREALRQLAEQGLVTTIPQKGVIVAIPSPKEVAEVYELRAVLEGLIARHFAEKASDAQVTRLRAAFGEMETRYREGEDPRDMLRAKAGLYDVLFEGADNATIRSILESFQARIAVMRATTMVAPGRAQHSLEEIRAIVEAIERRDAAAAEQASVHHVQQAARTLFATPEMAAALEGTRR
jgi:DNA-binding GntR family transcriptional regulator